MNDERLQILKMVQEGKLSPEEAAKLLEAVEQPAAKERGPKPKHLRLVMVDGPKRSTFSVGVGLATWALKVVPGTFLYSDSEGQRRIDTEAVLEAVESGTTGKVMEIVEGQNRLEIWLEA